MNISELSIEKIENYDPFNRRAKANGMVTEWVARNEWGIRWLLEIQKRNVLLMQEGTAKIIRSKRKIDNLHG